MKKLIFIFILLLLNIIYPKISLAVFQKSTANPILIGSNNNDWDKKDRLLAHIIYDENKYKMWFTGYDGYTDKIGYATSLDGKTWDFNLSNPVLSPNLPTEIHYSDPFVIHDLNGYMMWLTVNEINGKYKIKVSTSINGINWTTPQAINTSQQWETTSWMVQPSVIKENGTYMLWYSSQKDGQWKMGYATSNDGTNWNKNPYPVLEATKTWEENSLGGGKVLKRNGEFEIYYHAGDPPSIGMAKSNNGVVWTKPENNQILTSSLTGFDSIKLLSPSAVYTPDFSKNYLYYTGYDGVNYSIGLAIEENQPSTPSLNPVIILPGMFGSWNSKAILEDENVPQSDWTTPPFVKDYEGIVKTLESAGYIKDENLFVFSYDWRKPVEESALDLKNYINNVVSPKNPDIPVYLVGHSLGGLVGRTYLQMFDNFKVEHLITLGTPHSGAIQAYKAWEGGVIENKNPWEKLALEVVLGVNRNGFRTNKDVIREMVPVVRNLLPTFDYLVKQPFSIDVPVTSQTQQNNLLPNLETNFPDYYGRFYSFVGETGQTPEKYSITKASVIENMLGLWQDGKPVDTLYTNLGDEVVLTKSATRNSDLFSTFPNINHRNLVSDQTTITLLMEKLNAKPQTIITPPVSPPLIPSLIFALKSPAEIEVNGPSVNYPSEDNKFIFIPNAQSGDYKIDVKGNALGKYHLLIGDIVSDKSTWQDIVATTNTGETDSYTVTYNPDYTPPYSLIDQNGDIYLNSALTKIEELKEQYPNWTLTLAIQSLNKINEQITIKKYKKVDELFKNTVKYLFQFRRKQTIAYPSNLAYSAIEDLTMAYDKILTLALVKPNKIKVFTEIAVVNGLKTGALGKIKYLGNEQKAQSYNLAEEMLNQAQKDYTVGNLYKADIEVFIAKLLIMEI